jgi:transposase
MTFHGIDPSAETFTAGTYPPEAPASEAPASGAPASTFENSSEGIAAYVKTLPEDRTTFLVGVENTGVYSERLCYELHEAGVPLVLLDPGAIHRAFNKGPKTDARDAVKVAEYAFRYCDKLVRWQPRAVVVEQIRVLLATREQLVRQRTATRNARTSLSRKVVQTPGANTSLEAVAEYLKGQVKGLEAEIERLIAAHPTLAQGVSLLVGIPGVGLLLASQMLVLTSGFEALPGYRPLAHRLGIAPHPHRSGTSVRRKDRSRRYGPRVMRKLLHLAARSVRTHDARSRRYFEQKVAAGKATRLVLNNLANRVLRVMCAVLKSREPYRPGHVSISPQLLTSHRQSG